MSLEGWIILGVFVGIGALTSFISYVFYKDYQDVKNLYNPTLEEETPNPEMNNKHNNNQRWEDY